MNEDMSRYLEHDLGTAGLTYLRQCLDGGKVLSHLLLRDVDLSAGSTTTYLPAGLDVADLHDFSQGGKASLGRTRRWVTGALAKSLSAIGPSGLVLLEHDLAMAGDPWLKRRGLRWAAFRDDVYFVCAFTDSRADINETLSHMAAQVVRGAAARVPRELLPGSGNVLAPRLIEAVAKETRLIVVSAFDGEGYVLWNKA